MFFFIYKEGQEEKTELFILFHNYSNIYLSSSILNIISIISKIDIIIIVLYVQEVVTHLCIVTYYIKLVTTSWTDSICQRSLTLFYAVGYYIQWVKTSWALCI